MLLSSLNKGLQWSLEVNLSGRKGTIRGRVGPRLANMN